MRHALSVLWVALILAGCDSDITTGPPPRPRNTNVQASGPLAEDDAGIPVLSLRDDDFVETDSNRDPFRSFAASFRAQTPDSPQRTVKMPNTAIDEMRLIAVVAGVANPRAMLLDATGVGVVVERGDYVGRPEVVQLSGDEGMGITLNWRVDRIRSSEHNSEIVFTREDPTGPDHPPLTRVLTVHDPDESSGAH